MLKIRYLPLYLLHYVDKYFYYRDEADYGIIESHKRAWRMTFT